MPSEICALQLTTLGADFETYCTGGKLVSCTCCNACWWV